MNRKSSLQGVICLWVLFIGFNLAAQNEAREVTRTYVLKNAIVVQKPGTILPSSHVVISNGLIEAIGTDVIIPFDAKIIDADSMYVYAGFIDAASHTGIPKKEETQERPTDLKPGSPPNNLAGITPDHKAVDIISIKEKSIKAMRDNGFAISHVVPSGKMLPGQGAIIANKNGSIEEILLRKKSSMYATLRGASRMYPSTVIGVMAKWRDLFHNAKYQGEYLISFAMNPVGKKRAMMDEATAAMQDVVNGDLTVFFKADKALDVRRVLRLKNELGFKVVLTDVEQAFPLTGLLKENNVPILLATNLPKEAKKKKEKKKEESETSTSDAEKDALIKRKEESAKQYVSQAAMLEKAGIKFGFSFIDGKVKEFKANIRRMIEAGLSEEGALAAMTTTPASIIGLEKVAGTIETGKMANLVVTDKSYFDEKSNIRYVIVDGHLNEYPVKEKKKITEGNATATAALPGEWSYEIEIPGQTQTGVLVVEKEDDEFEIKFASSQDPENFRDGDNVELEGNTLTFDATVDNNGFTMNLAFDIDVDGDTFEGTVSVGQFGSFPISGDKTGTPD